jgi:hypothetical protein
MRFSIWTKLLPRSSENRTAPELVPGFRVHLAADVARRSGQNAEYAGRHPCAFGKAKAVRRLIEGVRPCLLSFMAFSADLLPCQENREWNMLGLFTT